jgi:Xaa-Pro aminopeptidase
LAARGAALWLDTSSVNAAIVNAYKAACDRCYQNYESKHKTESKGFDRSIANSDVPIAVQKSSPVSLAKAIKNETELKGMQDCHLR